MSDIKQACALMIMARKDFDALRAMANDPQAFAVQARYEAGVGELVSSRSEVVAEVETLLDHIDRLVTGVNL